MLPHSGGIPETPCIVVVSIESRNYVNTTGMALYVRTLVEDRLRTFNGNSFEERQLSG